ncbi:FAD:protein FMN transferase, partial [hydrothermal vent metagenome]
MQIQRSFKHNPFITTISASSKRQIMLSSLFWLTIIIAPLTSCTPAPQSVHKTSIIVFGTTVDISILPPPHQAQLAEQAIQSVEQQFHQFHQQWHAWEEGGIVSKINHAISQQQSIVVAKSVKDFIVTSQLLTKQSQGLFDPGIGQLIALWGFHAEEWQGPPPSEQAIQHWLNRHPSLLDIYFQGNELHSRNPSVQLDFGGNAKGLAIHLALKSLKQSGIQNALVSIGGDMKAIGSKNGQPWRVGIQNPQHPSHVL